jgi:hypothetical protein
MMEMTDSSVDEYPGGVTIYFTLKEIKSFSSAFWIHGIFILIWIDWVDRGESLSAAIRIGEYFWFGPFISLLYNQR